MGSKNLRSKRQKSEKEGGDMLIDLLTEDVVSNILSHLPTAEAVKTSILSKRWRTLWTTISHLDFSANIEVQIKKFEKCVNAVMLRLNPTNSIDKCSFYLGRYSDILQINKWISSVVERNVKDLTLQTFTFNHIDLPSKVFGCKSLEALRLNGVRLKIPKQGFVCFPNLKLLVLERVSISEIPAEENSPCFPKLKNLCLNMVRYDGKDDCVMKLIRNCPLLEDLTIHRDLEHNVSDFDMCIPQLTKVDLSCVHSGDIVGLHVQIEAPIRYLTISNWNPGHRITVKNRDSLIGAELNFDIVRCYDFQGKQRDELLKILEVVDKVKYLSLGWPELCAIKASRIILPLFSNVIRLEVYLGCKHFYMLECLLNSTINLQILVFEKIYPCREKGCVEKDGRWSESHVPKCVLSSLKRIEIFRSSNCPGELEMIKTILNSAKVLEKLILSGITRDLRGKISKFPRASASCQLDFPEFD